jgi:hypothetical protein
MILSVLVTFMIVIVFSDLCFDTIERLCSVVSINYRKKKGAKDVSVYNNFKF